AGHGEREGLAIGREAALKIGDRRQAPIGFLLTGVDERLGRSGQAAEPLVPPFLSRPRLKESRRYAAGPTRLRRRALRFGAAPRHGSDEYGNADRQTNGLLSHD